YHILETVAKYINRLNKSDNTNNYDGCPELDMTTLFDHTTQVAAAYVNYTYSRDKWTGRAGLRYEFSHLSGKYPDGSAENFHRNLNDWVPDLSVEYKPSWANSYKLSFSTSIERPGITYLNPAIQSTPTTLSFGNPMLASAHIYKLAFTYLHLGAKLTYSIAPDLSFSNNQIIGVQYLLDGKMTSTFENTLKSRRIGVNGFAQWQIGATTSWMLNANVGHNHNRSDVLELTNEHWSSFMYTQLTQKLPWKLTMTAGVGENSGMIDGLYGHRNGMWFYTMSLQRSFLKEDRLTVSLRASNFFNHKFNSMTTYITRGDYTGTSSMKFIMRGAMLNVSYRFGSLKAKVKKTNATINNDDVVGGSKAGNDQTQQSGMGGTSM
ncbi:MAG: TonB-dependent receptor family protein, partial [Bacteroidales bacterium]|nr:TonB-dependent receptor family protein [Candidatus Sodaliphilus aphodohippi]